GSYRPLSVALPESLHRHRSCNVAGTQRQQPLSYCHASPTRLFQDCLVLTSRVGNPRALKLSTRSKYSALLSCIFNDDRVAVRCSTRDSMDLTSFPSPASKSASENGVRDLQNRQPKRRLIV